MNLFNEVCNYIITHSENFFISLFIGIGVTYGYYIVESLYYSKAPQKFLNKYQYIVPIENFLTIISFMFPLIIATTFMLTTILSNIGVILVSILVSFLFAFILNIILFKITVSHHFNLSLVERKEFKLIHEQACKEKDISFLTEKMFMLKSKIESTEIDSFPLKTTPYEPIETVSIFWHSIYNISGKSFEPNIKLSFLRKIWNILTMNTINNHKYIMHTTRDMMPILMISGVSKSFNEIYSINNDKAISEMNDNDFKMIEIYYY